jgi:signal-transduction protein with cAMP-binding, CBS, and nucleotidyltransferase domain
LWLRDGACSDDRPLASRSDVIAFDLDDFIFEALIKMTRHNKRRLAVRSNGEYVGYLKTSTSWA